MLGSNIDELQLLWAAANGWRNAGLGITPDPVELTQINAIIHGRPVVLAWDTEAEDWQITAS